MSVASIDVVKRAYDFHSRQDMVGVLQLFDQNARWTTHGNRADTPLAGEWVGREKLRELLATVPAHYDVLKMQPVEFLAGDHHVTVLLDHHVRAKATGREARGVTCHVFRVKEGKITQVDEWANSEFARLVRA